MVSVGDVIAGKYRVEWILGRGGMGMVVAATHIDLGELRAVKLMLPGALGDRNAVERFVLEARAAARLRSPHAVTIHDVGTLDSGEPYMVMPHLEGRDLRAELSARGVLPADVAVAYVLQACEALAEAHARGIVHRDLKPANLYLSRGSKGEPWVTVLDFGIAKVPIDSGVQGGARTATNAMMGTPQYMSPEQFRSTRGVDARSDIWSLGVILYELVSGAAPFQGQSVFELFEQVCKQAAVPLSQARPGLPEGLVTAIQRCLEKDRANRFQSVEQLTAALEPFAGKVDQRTSGEEHDAETIERTGPRTETRRAPGTSVPEPTVPVLEQNATAPADTHLLPTLPRARRAAPAVPNKGIVGPGATSRSHAPAALGAAMVAVGLGLGAVLWLALRAGPEPEANPEPVGPTKAFSSFPNALPSAAPSPSVTESASSEPTHPPSMIQPPSTPDPKSTAPRATVSVSPSLKATLAPSVTPAPATSATNSSSPLPSATTTTTSKDRHKI